MKSFNRILFEELLAKNQKFLKGTTLNVGGGDKPYRELCSEMVSMDLFEKNPMGRKLDFDVKADATKSFPFKPNSFDSVLCTFFLQSVIEPKAVIENISEVLKPGGFLVISTPFLDYYKPDPVDYWRFSHNGLKVLFEKRFKIIKMEPLGGRYLWFLSFLQLHKVPSFFTKSIFPIVKFLTKKEKNKHKWTAGFFLIMQKR